MTMKSGFAAALCASISLIAMPGMALAETGAEPANAPSAGTTDRGVEEIVVRAQRLSQSLQSVPVAVTPVSAKELENKRLHDLPQLTLAVPSLQVTTDNAFTLRGIGSQIYSANVDSSVGVMVDDVSLGVPIFMSNAAFVDMDQVEVLTGPQGLLFGRNSSAGLMNIITKKPVLGKFGGEVSGEYDNRDAPGGSLGVVGTAVLNLPTSSHSALRLNLLESVQDPIAKVLSDSATNLQDKQIRTMAKAKWLWEPSADISVYAIGDYSRERGIGGIWDDTWRQTGAGGNDARNAALDGVTPGTANFYKSLGGEDFRSVDTGGISLTLTDRLSGTLTLSNILAWRTYLLNYNLDSGGSATNDTLAVNAGHQNYNQVSEELRLAFKGTKLDGQVGVYGFAFTNDGTANFSGTAGTPYQNVIYGNNAYHDMDRSFAAYGQVNYHLTDAWQVIGGARVTADHVGVSALADTFPLTSASGAPCYALPFGPHGPCFPIVATEGPANQNYTASANHTNFSYKLGTQYTVSPGTMVYVTWSTGYKGPAMLTNLAYVGQSPYLQPETVRDLEGGVKAVAFDRKLRLNIAGFVENFRNFQTQSFATIGASQVSVIGNAEGVRAIGAEINSSFRPTSALTLNYNATFEHSYFTNYSTDPCYFGQATDGCSKTQPFFQGAGISTSTSAHYTGTVEAIYTIAAAAGKVELSGNWYHRSAINFTTSAAPYAQLGAIDVFGASATWRGDDGLTVAVFCKNCGNEIYPNYIGSDPGDAGIGVLSTINRWGYNSVRTIGVSLGIKF